MRDFIFAEDVLDKGFVELMDVMPRPDIGNADTAVATAARMSYLSDSKGFEADSRLIDRLMKDNHTSPFEMVELKFRVKAPLMVFWQWVRHRTFHYQSINSQSGRYTPFDEDEVYIPKEWRKQDSRNKQASSDESFDHNDQFDFNLWMHFITRWGQYYYHTALEKGMAREQARLFLPGFAMYYTWIVKVDLHNLFHFLKLRLAPDAQWEIRQYAEAMWDMVQKVAPVSAEAFKKYHLESNNG